MNQVYIEDEDEDNAPKPIFTSYKVYKIRNKKTGLYSNGRSYVSWSKDGKEWKTLAPVSNHLASYTKNGKYGNAYWNDKGGTPIEDVEIVQFTRSVSTIESKVDRGDEYLKAVLDKRAKRVAAQAKATAQYKLALAEQEFKMAQEKLNKLKG